jgi:hypothetical protein
MMKLVSFIVISITLVACFFVYKKVSLLHKFKNDENYVRETMLQKDSEGRGFSDIVKAKTDKGFKDPEIKSAIYQFAKVQRKVVLSKNKSEFLSAIKKSMLSQNCMYFIMELKHTEEEQINNVVNSTAFDNDEMNQYREYLSLVRFEDTLPEINSMANDRSNRVNSLFEYKQKCNLLD